MIKQLPFLFVIACMTNFLHAENHPSAYTEPVSSNSSITIGGEVDYVRVDVVDISSSQKGYVGGPFVSYDYVKKDGLYANLYLYASWGRTHIAHDPHHNLKNHLVEGRLGYNQLFAPQKDWMITPYFGVTYRRLTNKRTEDEVDGVTVNALTYKYEHLMLPLGLMVTFFANDNWTVATRLEYAFDLDAVVEIAQLSGVKWVIDHEFYFEGELPITYSFGKDKKLNISLVPKYEFFRNGASKSTSFTGLALGITRETYIFWGGKLLLSYKF